MSLSGNTRRRDSDEGTTRRARAQEPAEQRRAAARKAGRCITPGCGARCSTQRCSDCMRRIEAATARSHGQGKQGSPTILASDLSDLRRAAVSVNKAIIGWEVVDRHAVAPRDRELVLAEPAAQVLLAIRFCREVLRRHRKAIEALKAVPVSKPRSPQLSFRWRRGG